MNANEMNKVDIVDDLMENISDLDERILTEFFQALFNDNPFAGMSKIISRTDNFPELVSQGLGGFSVVITPYDITEHPFYDVDLHDQGESVVCWHIALTRQSVFNALVTVDIGND
jgi:hypothetical protein